MYWHFNARAEFYAYTNMKITLSLWAPYFSSFPKVREAMIIERESDTRFSKIRSDTREWMFISGVNDTGDKREQFWGLKFFIFGKNLVECTLHL